MLEFFRTVQARELANKTGLPALAILYTTLISLWPFYSAIRKSKGKTVMAAKNSGESDALFRGEGSPADEDRRALDHLFSVTYEELRRLATTVRRNDPNTTLNPTALVNEAWLRLSKSPKFAATSPLHFKRIAAELPSVPV